MSVHQQQTQKTVTDMSEADAIISQMAEQARDAQAVLPLIAVDEAGSDAVCMKAQPPILRFKLRAGLFLLPDISAAPAEARA